jgi:hypothetical protein
LLGLKGKATSKNVIPAEAGIQTCPCESREPYKEPTGLPPEFTPYLIWGGSDKLIIIRGSLNSLTQNKFEYYNKLLKSIPSGHPSPFPSPLQGEREGVRGQFERN